MRSGAEPGPREDPADEDALGNPLAGFLAPSSSLGRFAATMVREDDLPRRVVRRFVVVVVVVAGAVRESVNILLKCEESNSEVKVGALALDVRHLHAARGSTHARFPYEPARDRLRKPCRLCVRRPRLPRWGCVDVRVVWKGAFPKVHLRNR